MIHSAFKFLSIGSCFLLIGLGSFSPPSARSQYISFSECYSDPETQGVEPIEREFVCTCISENSQRMSYKQIAEYCGDKLYEARRSAPSQPSAPTYIPVPVPSAASPRIAPDPSGGICSPAARALMRQGLGPNICDPVIQIQPRVRHEWEMF